ncbi:MULTISPECIES: hypothetical protein [unclassified Mesorhizobium]|uniref:hypothetical protein n=1 Tax=unclassified Mesorhizobium TaxID=325217 RepID=UPI0015E2B29D|nr:MULTISPECIES: hypothetical protein [unclassified Mesorhizobium]MBZ9974080.1 hypothetical protein [Mesorhizobium sp. BR-1-1-10]
MQNVSDLVVPSQCAALTPRPLLKLKRIGYALPAGSSEVDHLGLASGHRMQGQP